MVSSTTRALLGWFVLLAALASGCGPEPTSRDPVTARLYVFGGFDPDFTNLSNPEPARIVWMSTRAGTGRFLSNGREVTDDRAPVSGGELVSTDIPPSRLEPGFNDVEIYFVLEQQGSSVLSEVVLVNVEVECTRHDHCPGSCVDYTCQD